MQENRAIFDSSKRAFKEDGMDQDLLKKNSKDSVKDSKIEARVDQLEALVEELLKDNPVEDRIEKKMKELSITYTEDPVERINRVLEVLHPYQVLEFEGE
jgi:hypothetical protein